MSDEEVRLLSRKLDRVLDVLNNHDETGEKGLVAKVAGLSNDLHSFIAQYNIDQAIKKSDIKWIAAIFGTLGTIAAFIGKFIIGLIFK